MTPCKGRGKLEGVRVTDPAYGDGKRMMPGQGKVICYPGAGADVHPSVWISFCNFEIKVD